ncbi:MAG: hypothetical protein VCA74_03810 [Deltaproteobacteria bacterium]
MNRRVKSRIVPATTRVLVVALLFAVAALPQTSSALCGDPGGDGYIRASDALVTLKAAVLTGIYDPLIDVDGGTGIDGQILASDALVVLRSAVFGTIPDCAAATENSVVVTTASCDFATGGTALVDESSISLSSHTTGMVSADSVVRLAAGRLFVLNRYGADNLQELKTDDPGVTLGQCSLGNGSNPHDIVIVSETLGYVSLYDSSKLSVIDPSALDDCEGFEKGVIDLSAFADDDGFPETDQMALVGDTLLVTLQRLDRSNFFQPAVSGLLLSIDTSTNTVSSSLELSIKNPFAETKGLIYDEDSGLLYVGGPGKLFDDLEDGGIEVIDPATMTSQGVVISGAQLGGDLTDFVVVGSSRIYALVATDGFSVSLVEADLATGSVTDVLATSDLLMSDIELTQNGRLWLADRNCLNPGLRVFTIGDNRELTDQPLYPGLTPFTLTFLP